MPGPLPYLCLVAGTSRAPRFPCGPAEPSASNPWWLEERPGVEPEGPPKSLQGIEAGRASEASALGAACRSHRWPGPAEARPQAPSA